MPRKPPAGHRPKTPDTGDRMLRIDDVRHRYGDVNPDTVLRWVDADQFPVPVKVGGIWLWSVAELDKFDRERLAQAKARRAAIAQGRAEQHRVEVEAAMGVPAGDAR